jgi:hypothetical protein
MPKGRYNRPNDDRPRRPHDGTARPERRYEGTENARDYRDQNGDYRDYDDREPLSLAEEIAEEVDRGGKLPTADGVPDNYEKVKQGEIHIAELQKMSMQELI